MEIEHLIVIRKKIQNTNENGFEEGIAEVYPPGALDSFNRLKSLMSRRVRVFIEPINCSREF